MSDKELQERCLDNLFLEELPFKIPVTFKEGIKGKNIIQVNVGVLEK